MDACHTFLHHESPVKTHKEAKPFTEMHTQNAQRPVSCWRSWQKFSSQLQSRGSDDARSRSEGGAHSLRYCASGGAQRKRGKAHRDIVLCFPVVGLVGEQLKHELEAPHLEHEVQHRL